MGSHELLKVSEAMEYLRVSRATLFRLLKSGQIARVKVGRCSRIPVESLRAFVRQAG